MCVKYLTHSVTEASLLFLLSDWFDPRLLQGTLIASD